MTTHQCPGLPPSGAVDDAEAMDAFIFACQSVCESMKSKPLLHVFDYR